MKTRILALFVGLLAVLPMTSAWAGDAYANLTVKVNPPEAAARVCVTVGKTAPADSAYTAGSAYMVNKGQTSSLWSWTLPASWDFYAWVKSDSEAWEFQGWTDENGKSLGTGTSLKVSASTDKSTSPGVAYVRIANFKCLKTDPFSVKFLPAVNGSYTANDTVITAETESDTFDEPYQVKFAATPDKPYEIDYWYTMEADGSKKSFSTTPTTTKTFSAPATVGVAFKARPVVTLTCEEAAGNYGVETAGDAVDGVEGSFYSQFTVTLKSKKPEGREFFAWYVKDANGAKTYSYDSTFTGTFSADTTVGAEFLTAEQTASVGEFADLVAALADDGIKMVTIPADKTVTVAANEMLTVPAGKQVVVDGTLKVVGSVVNNGIIGGNGTIERSYRTIIQSSEIHVPYPYGTDGLETGNGVDGTDGTAGKYVVTTSSEPSTSGIGTVASTIQVKWFVTVINGDGEQLTSKPSVTTPKAIVCKVNRKYALNWITEIVQTEYASTDAALDATGYTTVYKDSEKMALLVEDCSGVYSSISSGTAAKGFAVDCAGHSIAFSPKQFGGEYLMRFFNGSSTISCKIMRPHCCYYNCSYAKISTISIKYTSGVSLYDTTSTSFNYADSLVDGCEMRFYSGNKFSSIPTKMKPVVYGGTFAVNPTAYLADPNHFEAYTSDNKTWTVREKADNPLSQPFAIGETAYGSLAEALAAAGVGDVIKLKKDSALDASVQVEAGKDVILDLSGWTLSGNGSIENNGTLVLIDSSGAKAPSKVVPAIVNKAGNLYLGKSTYSGAITLMGGKCWFLNGTFNGGVTVDPSAGDPAAVAEVCCGTFAIATFAYGNEQLQLKTLCPGGWAFGSEPTLKIVKAPKANLTGTTSYTITAFDAADAALYEMAKTKLAPSDYQTRADWVRALEISAAKDVFALWGIDCTLTFDRKVAKGSLKVNASGLSGELPDDVSAGYAYSALLPKIRDAGYSPWSYTELLPGGEHDELSGISVSGVNDENCGTTCVIEMRLANGIKSKTSPYDYSYDRANSIVLCSVRQVFGAGANVAMIRPAAGAATFYPTLKAAFEAAKNGETVMLCNDCTGCEPIGQECKFAFDANGFEFSGVIAAVEGFIVKKNGQVYSVDKAAEEVAEVEIAPVQGGSQGATVSVEVEDNWVKKVADDGKTVAEALLDTEENGLKVWENKLVEQAEAKGDVGHGFAAVSKTETVVDGKTVVETVVTENKSMESSEYSVAALETGTYQPTKIVKDAKDQDVAVPDVSKPAVNVVKNKSKSQTVVLAIPGDTTVDDVVKTPNEGDEIRVYDVDKGGYLCWTYGETGWSPKASQINEEYVMPTAADGQSLTSGMAVIYVKRDAAKEVTVAAEGDGVFKTELLETTTETDESKGKWNLVANPTAGDFDLNKIDGSQDAGHAVAATDRIVVLAETGLGRVDFKKGESGKWGRWKTTEYQDAKGRWRTRTEWDESATLKKGQAMWYISNGGNPQIKWSVK